MVHLNTSHGDSIYNYSPSSFTCGGTLISDRHILTAAHCITDFNAYKLKITLGSPDLGNVNRLKVEWFSIFAQNYDDDYNLAIIKLKSPVTFSGIKKPKNLRNLSLKPSAFHSDSVRPICLPKYDDPDHVNDPVVITGWGKTSGKSINYEGCHFLIYLRLNDRWRIISWISPQIENDRHLVGWIQRIMSTNRRIRSFRW